MATIEIGQDYNVAYKLRSGQQGRIVLRFAQAPSKRDIARELEKYGIQTADIADTHYQVVARVGSQAPAPKESSALKPVKAIPATPTRPRVKKGVIVRSLVSLYLVFLIPAIPTGFQAVDLGRAVAAPDPFGICETEIKDAAVAGIVPDFPAHPAYVTSYIGCVAGGFLAR